MIMFNFVSRGATSSFLLNVREHLGLNIGCSLNSSVLQRQRSRKTPCKGVLLILAGACGILGSAQSRVQWQDTIRNPTVLVNVNQYIWDYIRNHPTWFSPDEAVTDFAIQNVSVSERPRAAEQYLKVRAYLEKKNLNIGTYMSGTTVGPDVEQTRYPPTNIAIENMPADARYVSTWPGDPNRMIIDVSDAATRHALHAEIQRNWKAVPAPIRFVDNAAIHSSAGKAQAWADYCQNMQELREIAEALGSRAIFNISAHIGTLSGEEIGNLLRAIGDNGIALEMPAPRLTDDAETLKAEVQYRELLDAGMGIIMIPVNIGEEQLTRWTLRWKRPDDHLYIARLFWKPPPSLEAGARSRK